MREVFLWTSRGRRRGGERHDGVDGGLKGNERRMQAWVRIAAKAGDSLCRRAREKKERRDVRVGE